MSSLVEVLVAMALFVLAFVTVVSPLQQGHRSAVECDRRVQALALATDLIEQQRCLPFSKVVALQGTEEPYSYTLQVKQQPNLKVLTLQVRWGENGQLNYGTMIQGDAP